MLYNQDWEKRDENPFTLTNLIAWLRTKDREKRYPFTRADKCLVAQWTQSIDPGSHVDQRAGSGSFWYVVNGKSIDLSEFRVIANNPTFGAALNSALNKADAQMSRQEKEKTYAV